MKRSLKCLCASTLLALSCQLALATDPTPSTIQPELLFNIPKSQFKPLKGYPGQFYYHKPGADLLQYNQIMVAPLVILEQNQHKQWQALVSDENGQAAQLFHQTMTKALQEQGLKVTDQPGPGVVILRVAVTHIEQNPQGFEVSDVLPIKMVFNLARRATGLQKYIVKLSTLGQLDDAQTGQMVAGGFGLRQENKSGAEAVSMRHFQDWLNSWSTDVAVRLAQTLPGTKQ